MKTIVTMILIAMFAISAQAEDVVKYDKPKIETKPISKPNHPNTGRDLYLKQNKIGNTANPSCIIKMNLL